MLNGDTRLRVYNDAVYDIGVTTLTGISFNIRPKSFQMLTVNDITYIESAYPKSAFFSRGLLRAVDETGKTVPITEMGFPESENKHMSEDDIKKMLGKSVKAIEEWLESVSDDSELHTIFTVADKMDLPASKLKILSKYMPNKDWLDQLGE